ncbi:MAG: hypothetical protein RIS88_2767 [Pseudomonadota bacterium]|jgi:hypothetical protein
MTHEEWRQSLAPNYEVSSLGRVRRAVAGRKTYAGRVMKQQLLSIGYLSVKPTINGKNVSFYVHDLVAAAFIGQKPEGGRVNHIDGVKTNNAPHNLEYVSHAENMRHAAESDLLVRGEDHHAHKLTEDRVRELRADRSGGMSFSKLAKKHGVSIATAFHIAKGHYWSHVE